MAGAKEIRTKIKSVRNTQKITKAMEMVAASKMRRAQESMRASRAYAHEIRHLIGHIAKSNPEDRHPYMDLRAVQAVGYIVVSTDRGLCGGLNINLYKKVLLDMKKWQEQGVKTQVFLIGSKAEAFFKRVDTQVVAYVHGLGDHPDSQSLVGGVKVMLDAFDHCQLDQLFLCYNDFINTMIQSPTLQPLLPLPSMDDLNQKHHWDYLYEPDPQTLLSFLLTRYIESQVYQGVLENIASEQAARMVAMKAASENAGEVIGELKLIYNKARQAAITQELSEIVAGAAAV